LKGLNPHYGNREWFANNSILVLQTPVWRYSRFIVILPNPNFNKDIHDIVTFECKEFYKLLLAIGPIVCLLAQINGAMDSGYKVSTCMIGHTPYIQLNMSTQSVTLTRSNDVVCTLRTNSSWSSITDWGTPPTTPSKGEHKVEK